VCTAPGQPCAGKHRGCGRAGQSTASCSQPGPRGERSKAFLRPQGQCCKPLGSVPHGTWLPGRGRLVLCPAAPTWFLPWPFRPQQPRMPCVHVLLAPASPFFSGPVPSSAVATLPSSWPRRGCVRAVTQPDLAHPSGLRVQEPRLCNMGRVKRREGGEKRPC